jgi:hypothetical protein
VRQPDRGFRLAKCRNNGARAASGDLLVFADQDLVFTRDYLRTFAEAARPRTFLVSWPVRLTAEQTEEVTDDFVRRGAFSGLVTPAQAALVRKQFRKDLFYFWLHRLGVREIGPKLRGGIFAVSKTDYSSVNGFDEAYQGWGNEDDDLGRRLHRSGVRGRNVFRTEYPVHLFHPPFNAGGARPNLEYYERRVREIRKGDFRCRYGLESPLGNDEVTVTDLC